MWQVNTINKLINQLTMKSNSKFSKKRSSTAQLLSKKLDYSFADADDFHSEENKQLMRDGIPLTDENRLPWLTNIRNHLKQWCDSETNGIIACSALKKQYRDFLNDDIHCVKFILLNVEQHVIEQRIGSKRADHFLTDSLSIIPSQFKALELPDKQTSSYITDFGYLCREESFDSFYYIFVVNCEASMSLETMCHRIQNEIICLKCFI